MSLAERPTEAGSEDGDERERRSPETTKYIDARELAAIAASVGRSGAERLVASGPKRRWTYAVETERFEAVVIAWPPGCGLRMHDHDGSIAAIYVINGQLRERYIDDAGTAKVRWLSAGETIELAASHVHEVINLHDREVVSVHVYSPPLGDADFRTDNEIDISPPDRRV